MSPEVVALTSDDILKVIVLPQLTSILCITYCTEMK